MTGHHETGQMQRQEIKVIHPSLYPILHKIFNEFWEMNFDPQVAIPFFSLITPENCEELGLPNYFKVVPCEGLATTLVNIKVF